MKLFMVSFGSRIARSYDYVYVMAENSSDALKIAKPMLDTHKLVPDFLNEYSRYNVREVQ